MSKKNDAINDNPIDDTADQQTPHRAESPDLGQRVRRGVGGGWVDWTGGRGAHSESAR